MIHFNFLEDENRNMTWKQLILMFFGRRLPEDLVQSLFLATH